MARCVDPDTPGPVIELGSGTGAVTKALVARGIEPSRLVLVEFNPSFCRLLRTRYPEATVIQGDAYRIEHLLGGLLKRAGRGGGVGIAADDQAVQAADSTDRRSLRVDGARRSVRAVHLRHGDADPETSRGRRARPRADLAEPAAGACVGLSEELIGFTSGRLFVMAGLVPAIPIFEASRGGSVYSSATPFYPSRGTIVDAHACSENPGLRRIDPHRLVQCEARGARGQGAGADRRRRHPHLARGLSAADLQRRRRDRIRPARPRAQSQAA